MMRHVLLSMLKSAEGVFQLSFRNMDVADFSLRPSPYWRFFTREVAPHTETTVL